MRPPLLPAFAALLLVGLAAPRCFAESPASDAPSYGDLAKWPFQRPLALPEALEGLDNLERQLKSGAWDRAFAALAKLRGQKPQGYAPGANGWCEPIEQRIRRTLENLSAEGRDTFRLFHDAEARKALDEAVGKDERAKLEHLVQWYAPCPAADEAGLRLADEYFEEGRHAEAAALWQAALDRRSDTAPGAARLIFKLGLAYVRSGRPADAARLAGRLRERHATARLAVGGAEIDPGAALAKLAAEVAPPAVFADIDDNQRRLPVDSTLPPADAKPVWRHEYLDRAQRKEVEKLLGIGLLQKPPTLWPAGAAVAGKLVLNHDALALALDLKTGKPIWRTDASDDALTAAGRQRASAQRLYVHLEDYHSLPASPRFVAARDGRVIVNRVLGNGMKYDTPYWVSIEAIDAVSGKPAVEKALASGFVLASYPLFAPDGTYFIGTRPFKPTELHAVRIGADGKAVWSTPLGRYNLNPELYCVGLVQVAPRCLRAGDALYVDTNWGTTLELDARSGRIRGAANYDSEPPRLSFYRYEGSEYSLRCGPLAYADGVFYSKGTKSNRLLATRAGAGGVAWQRALPRDAVLLDVGEGRVALAGKELTCLDAATQATLWTVPLPAGGDRAAALRTPNQYAFWTPRGVHLYDKRTGAALGQFRGVDDAASQGHLVVADGLLITVTDIAATAYRLPAAPKP